MIFTHACCKAEGRAGPATRFLTSSTISGPIAGETSPSGLEAPHFWGKKWVLFLSPLCTGALNENA